ncbi:MAG: serine hydrolase [Planctomycetota bacterium]|nr:serine hydrolase [Planctomycetota bacterium]
MLRHAPLLLVAALAACASDRGSWKRSSYEEAGIDRAAIEAFVAEVEAGVYGRVDHFLLIRGGRVVADHHFARDYAALTADLELEDHQYSYDHPDWHPYYQGSELHTLQSVTKSITSICVGIAIDEGHIPGGVATPAMSFFDGYALDLTDGWRRAMTLADVLTMRSGIDWDEMRSYDDATNTCIQLEASDTWIQFILDRPMREEPGTVFDYNSGASVLLGKIVRVATGQRIDEYAREKLFAPLGITDFHWKVTPDGEVDTEGGLYLAPHDLARIAQLFLQEGEWQGQRVVSAEWVRASVTPHVADLAPGNPLDDRGYGYQWWVPVHADGVPVQYQGSGYGGQFPIVVPELDLVIVFNAWNIHGAPAKRTWNAVQRVILPAVEPGR